MTHFDESNPYGDITHNDVEIDEIDTIEDSIDTIEESKKFSIGSVSKILQDRKDKGQMYGAVIGLLFIGLMGYLIIKK
jgi:tetrahydromethanopterin S-methyltransferase subunit G